MTTYIGSGISRIDGFAKVTGAAKYAADFAAPGLLFGSIVSATITKGRIQRIDVSAALRLKGVVDVFTHLHRPRMANDDKAYKDDVAPAGSPFRPLYDGDVKFNGQPIALVVATSSEVARTASALVKVDYIEEPHATDLLAERDRASPVAQPNNDFEALFTPPKTRGNPDRALATAAVRHVAEYSTPMEHHNPMELYGATVIYEAGGSLRIYDKTQGVQNVQRYICSVFGLDAKSVRVMSPFVGGAFGVGLRPLFEVVLAVMAARALRLSVRVVLSRPQMYALGYRPPTIQKVSLGASQAGDLEAVVHEAVSVTSRYEDYNRQETGWSGVLYSFENAAYSHKLAKLDLPTSCDMRCPSAATGVYALECAMDELAIALDQDPLALRMRYYSERNQNTGQPFSSKALRECYLQGAEAFGWSRRNKQTGSMRDGKDLVGWGMATGVWDAWQTTISVRITLKADGRAEVACATSDIGTGTYTIMAQVAADALGVPIEDITIKLGDSSLPKSPVEGGSWIAASVSSGIVATAAAIRDELLRLAQKSPGSSFAKVNSADVVLANRSLVSTSDASRSISISKLMQEGSLARIERELTTSPANDTRAHNTHSAVFAEVKVDEEFGVVRVTRVVTAVAAGRILNTKTATSQVLGSVIWGIGMALHEETLVDHRTGRMVNASLAEYLVPVHADVHDIKVIFVDEKDDSNPLGVKGLGEVGIVGVPAAVANAIYHATGKRIRDLPITLDKLL